MGVRVKPIGRFLPRWREVRERARPGARLLFVGGGAGGAELALAARHALPRDTDIQVVTQEFLPGHGRRAGRLLADELSNAAIGLRIATATNAGEHLLELSDGASVPFDWLFWVTGVVAPDWVRQSRLATDGKGFVRVDAGLRSVSHPRVFAAGDVASLEGQQRPKSGVIAVRAGPVLATNLRRTLGGRRLSALPGAEAVSEPNWHRRWAGGGVEILVGHAGPVGLALERVDRPAFHAPVSAASEMAGASAVAAHRAPASLEAEAPLDSMRCGGCGAKLAAGPLRRVLNRLPAQSTRRYCGALAMTRPCCGARPSRCS